ncbi:MAG TPA: lipoyl synthase [Coriobacteriia bacterium]
MPYEHGPEESARRMPSWMRRPVAVPGRAHEVESLLDGLKLATVCRSAKCPNRGECYASGTATFLIMGDRCTRGCRFCAVETDRPGPLDPDEPRRLAEAARVMGLAHVVVTAVTRDDLADGGASHFAAVVAALREALPEARVEVLTSDFAGDLTAVDTVADARPDVFNHNVETVPRLYPEVRPAADYARSLSVLARVRDAHPGVPTKSGLMLGLGETMAEVVEVLHDLRRVGVDIVTIGQYLRPSHRHLPVARFAEPSEYDEYAAAARQLGFTAAACAPFVRSSYHAAEMAECASAANPGAPADAAR